MIVNCKTAEGNCPKNLRICCCKCEFCGTCAEACPKFEVKECEDREVIETGVEVFEAAVPTAIQNMADLLQVKKQLEEREKELKQELLEAMEKYGVKSFDTDLFRLTYVAPTTKTTIDSTKLKKEHPDIAEQYTKVSNVSASVRITVK